MAKIIEIPIWEKYALTIQEASEYSGIGEKKIRELINEHIADLDGFVLMNGSKHLIKRVKFNEFLDRTNVI